MVRKGGAILGGAILGGAIVMAVLGSVLFGTTVPAVAAGPAPEVAQTLTVTPASNLVDRDVVHGSGEGFLSDDSLIVVECSAGADIDVDCVNLDIGLVPANPDGTFSFDVSVRTLIHPRSGDVDCRVAACLLQVFNVGVPERFATAALGFDPSGPVSPPPTLSVADNHDLLDGDVVHFSGAHYEDEAFLDIAQCPPGAQDSFDCDLNNASTHAIATHAGHMSGSLRVLAIISPLGNGDTVDCRTVTCTLSVFDDFLKGPRPITSVDLAFTPDGGLRPQLQIDVSPSSGLADEQAVTMTVTGLSEDEVGYVGECGQHFVAGDDVLTERACREGVVVQGTGTGPVTTGLTVDRTMHFRSPVEDPIDIDCATVTCEVVVQSTTTRFASARISFGGQAPPARPVTVAPQFTG